MNKEIIRVFFGGTKKKISALIRVEIMVGILSLVLV